MPKPSWQSRARIAAAGYAVLAIASIAYFGLGKLPMELNHTHRLIISAVAVAPLLLALLWEHLKGFKVGEVEITLNEVAPAVDVELASAMQDLKGSETPALVQAICAAADRADLILVEVNLRSAPYWWSTRLFLLAAMAEEYTRIERLIFVEGDAARRYVGMAAPSGVRKALGKRFPDYDRVLREVLRNVRSYPSSSAQEVQNIGFQWPSALFNPVPELGGAPMPPNTVPTKQEREIRELVTSASLSAWIKSELETESREWDGAPASHSLYARILTCKGDYVPLLHRDRLEMVVNRKELAVKLASVGLG